MPQLELRPPFVGLNTRSDASIIEHNEATEAKNVVLDRGTIRKRAGYAVREAAFGGFSKLVADFVLENGTKMVAYISTTGRVHLEEGGDFTQLDMGTGSWVAGNEVPQAVVYNSRMYFVNGIKFYVIGSAETGPEEPADYTIFTNDLPAPTSDNTPTAMVTEATAGKVGGLDGEYSWKVTYYSEHWDAESTSSKGNNGQESTDDKKACDITCTQLDAADADARITHVKLYRKKLSSAETEWFLVDKYEIADVQAGVNGAAAERIRDDIPDEDVSSTEIAPFHVEYEFNDTTDEDHIGLRCLEVHNTVMFAAASDSRLYFSRPDNPGILADYINIGGSDSTAPITGIKSFGGQLFVFTTTDIWTVTGLIKNQFNIRKKVSGTGLGVLGSLVATDQGMYFWARDSIYAFDGNQVSKVSQPIENLIQDRHKGDDNEIFGAWDSEQECVFWTYSRASTVDRPTLVFNYKNSAASGKPSWTMWEFENAASGVALLTSAAYVQDPDDNGQLVIYGFSDGSIGTRTLSSFTDAGAAPIETKWVTGNIGGDAPGFKKRWGTMSIHIAEEAGGGNNLDITAVVGSLTASFPNLSLTEPVIWKRIRLAGDEMKLTIKHDSTSSMFELLKISIDVSKSGRGT